MKRNIPFGKPIIGEPEQQAVAETLASGMLVHGPRTTQFEQAFAEWAGGGHAVAVSSCTAGLHLTYFDLAIGPADEVIVPAMTHTATAHAVELCGATPVFVDAEWRTGNMDLDLIETAITPRTRALSIVHFLGVPVAMDRVNAIARQHDLFVVEDCALAIGTLFQGRHAGLHGDVGCFSFYPVKHMTTGEGGVVLTRHPEIAQRLTRKRAFGVDRHVGERTQPGIYDVTMLGFNYRMSEVEAAIGLEQLKRMQGFLSRRSANYAILAEELRGVPDVRLFAEPNGDTRSSHYCLSVVLEERLAASRAAIVATLSAAGVGTSVYYPAPVPHFRYYREKYGFGEDTFPVAAGISRRSIALPVGPHLVEDDMVYIADSLKRAIIQNR